MRPAVVPRVIGGAAAIAAACLAGAASAAEPDGDLAALRHGSGADTVDLAVGLWAWPLPMDWDGDGDLDLAVACPDKPSNGVWLFEDPGDGRGPAGVPARFTVARRVGPAVHNMQVSFDGGRARVLVPGHELVEFRENGFGRRVRLDPPENVHGNRVRANMWRLADFDADGDHDLLVGAGDWTDYGWDAAHDPEGRWHNGPLRGFVYLLRNDGDDSAPQFADPERLVAGAGDVEVFGWPSPCFADFDGDGDGDLVCGEFLDGFTWFENEGSASRPALRAGRRLRDATGAPLSMDLQMITPVAVDWDKDGDPDLVVGDEDGRVAFVENTGEVREGMPVFREPRYLRQAADRINAGALATPCPVDWDGDGDEDLVCGNTAGYLLLFENVAALGEEPAWAEARRLEAGGETIRIQAGPSGSIQGPCEAKWGYTTLSAADWDRDGLVDLIVNSILGEVTWFRNAGPREAPVLEPARPILVEWGDEPPRQPAWRWQAYDGRSLVTQWRTTPVATDFDGDGLVDLVLLDPEGFLCLWRRFLGDDGNLCLGPPERHFVDESGRPIRLAPRSCGASGRAKIDVTDWDGDGRLDLLVNSENAAWWRNGGQVDGRTVLKRVGNLGKRHLAGHTSSPAACDFDRDGRPDLLVGAEDGFVYHLHRRDAVAPSDEETAVRLPGRIEEADPVAGVPDPPVPAGAAVAETATSRGRLAVWIGPRPGDGGAATVEACYHDGGSWSRPVRVASLEDVSGNAAGGNAHPVLDAGPLGRVVVRVAEGDGPPSPPLRMTWDGGRTWRDAGPAR